MATLQEKSVDSSDSTEQVTSVQSLEVEAQLGRAFFSPVGLWRSVCRMMVKLFMTLANTISRPSLGIASMQGISSLSDGVGGSRTERTAKWSEKELSPNARPRHLHAKRGSSIDSSTSLLQLMCDRLVTIEDPFYEARLGNKSETLREVARLMSDVRLSDLGCEEALNTISNLSCQTIAEDDAFDLVLFLLPKGSRLLLHDHPGMTVLSYIVSGRMKVKTLDVVDEKLDRSGWKRARMAMNEVIDESTPTIMITPTSGNYHDLEAIIPCVMLDILLPPYCYDESRWCNYYMPKKKMDEVKIGEEVMLKQISENHGPDIVPLPYKGTKVQVKSYHI